MGEMADYYTDLWLDQGWSPVGSKRKQRRQARPQQSVYGPPIRCSVCGSTDVYWQTVHSKYEQWNKTTRDRHVSQTTADGFEDCDA